MLPLSKGELKAIGIAILVVVVLVGLSLYNAHEQALGAAKCEAAWTARLAKSDQIYHAAIQAETMRNDALAADLANALAGRKVLHDTITRDVDRIVDRPVYSSVCIDDDGLRDINAALTGRAPAGAGVPASALPASSADRR